MRSIIERRKGKKNVRSVRTKLLILLCLLLCILFFSSTDETGEITCQLGLPKTPFKIMTCSVKLGVLFELRYYCCCGRSALHTEKTIVIRSICLHCVSNTFFVHLFTVMNVLFAYYMSMSVITRSSSVCRLVFLSERFDEWVSQRHWNYRQLYVTTWHSST